MRQLFYYKMRQLLQNATFVTKCNGTVGIKTTKNCFFIAFGATLCYRVTFKKKISKILDLQIFEFLYF